MTFSKFSVVLVFILVALFTATVCCLSFHSREQVPDALIIGFFSWFSIEGGALAFLKIDERRQKSDIAALKKENKDLKKDLSSTEKRLKNIQEAARKSINGA